MAARIVNVPPHCGHCSMSISNTRLINQGPQAGWCRRMGRFSVNRTGRKPGF